LAIVLAAAFAAASIQATPAVAAGFFSGFDAGTQGWTCSPCGSGIGSVAQTGGGGNPGGFLSFTDGDSGSLETLSAFVGPGTWAGNRSAYFNGTLSFDLRLNAADNTGRTVEVLLLDPVDGAVVFISGTTPTTSWESSKVGLTQAPGWRYLGALQACMPNDQACIQSIPTLTKTQFTSVLTNFGGVDILADYQSSPGEETDLDNVALQPPTVAARTLTLSYAAAQHAFKGKLSSAVVACTSNQSVSVYRVRTGPDLKVGATKTNGSGVWSLTHSVTPGSYYAQALRTNSSEGTDCGVVKSSPLVIH
jgi:hypothetical protein